MKTLLLVIEDRIFAVDKMWSFRKHGFHLVLVTDGAEALEAVEDDCSIELVLMDIGLDNGISAITCAQRILEKHDIPLIFLTGYSDEQLFIDSEQINSYGYIAKDAADLFQITAIKAALRMFENKQNIARANELLIKSDVVDFVKFKNRKKMQTTLSDDVTALLEVNGVVAFEDIFQIEEIQKLQNNFSDVANVASVITTPDGTLITEPSNFCRLCEEIIRKTEKGLVDCIRYNPIFGKKNESDPSILTCKSGGLWDSGTPILLGGQHVANWLIGQVRNSNYPEEGMRDYADEIDVDDETLINAFREVPTMSYDQFAKITRALNSLINQFFTTAYKNVQQAYSIETYQENEELLKEACKQNRTLLRELQHRAKNSFALISSMIILVLDTVEDDDARNALKAISYRIGAISDLYSLLYTTDLVKEINLDEYLNKLSRSFENMSRNISFHKSFELVVTSVRTAIPIGIIVTELITNSMKHAFPDSVDGSVWITLKRKKSSVMLEIADNGIGYNETTDALSCDTFGLKFISALVSEIGGKLTMDTQKGSKIKIEFIS
ncbi:MAG: PocR ligand-binding domain-containing protein [Spirochaetes bacterium]|jgi:two-component sensor histidine kinase/ligand-binding sensor protein/DNA-binding NarL/FixJ family response regulator|nr:PocR ligand-binding domain-containing protein [Spirochaetota bacterium]